jgi:hypothetical protein
VSQQHYIEEINNKPNYPETDGSCVNGLPAGHPENTDQLSCIRWKKMFFRYGCHPEHSWPEHTHVRLIRKHQAGSIHLAPFLLVHTWRSNLPDAILLLASACYCERALACDRPDLVRQLGKAAEF